MLPFGFQGDGRRVARGDGRCAPQLEVCNASPSSQTEKISSAVKQEEKRGFRPTGRDPCRHAAATTRDTIYPVRRTTRAGALPFPLTPRHPTERTLPVYCRTGPVFCVMFRPHRATHRKTIGLAIVWTEKNNVHRDLEQLGQFLCVLDRDKILVLFHLRVSGTRNPKVTSDGFLGESSLLTSFG